MSRSCRMTSPPSPPAAWLLPLRFGVVGLLNTATGYAVFALFILMGLTQAPALILATIASVAFNFQTSRRLVFRAKGRWVRFVLVYVAVFSLDWGMLRVANHYGVSSLVAQLVLALPLAALSFVCQKVFVFSADARVTPSPLDDRQHQPGLRG